MALAGIAPPSRLRGLPESTQRQFDEFYSWILRLRLGESADSGDTNIVEILEESFFQDRFIGGALSVSGTNADANIGELQWNTVLDTAAGTVARVASTAGHIGVVRVTSNAASGRQSMYLGHAAVNGNLINLNDMDSTKWVVAWIQGRARFGFGNDSAGLGLGTENFRLEADQTAGVWACVTTGGGAATSVATAIPLVSGQFIEWRLQRVSANEYRFFANDELVHTAVPPSKLPTPGSLIGPALQTIQVLGAASIVEIDTFNLLLRQEEA